MAALDEIDCQLVEMLQELSEHSTRSDAAFARAVAAMPAVVRADVVAGADDVLLHLAVRDADELHRALLELKRAGAGRVRTMLRLQAVKPPGPLPVRPLR
ncbi:MAG TPA: Lrp/AsnC ligand binding domain-containing protein [Solirubrobacteraceae bacterium]|jgi:Lrp/AsnC family leucine-responsive transcriptional regulator|nr:Lrp/AsnC ligand binding domain-containing protein [Solirubrobacteraceae bacterium]